jgi:hypothetical protein
VAYAISLFFALYQRGHPLHGQPAGIEDVATAIHHPYYTQSSRGRVTLHEHLTECPTNLAKAEQDDVGFVCVGAMCRATTADLAELEFVVNSALGMDGIGFRYHDGDVEPGRALCNRDNIDSTLAECGEETRRYSRLASHAESYNRYCRHALANFYTIHFTSIQLCMENLR